MFHNVLYDCSELRKAFIFLSFVSVIMKMDSCVLKSLHLRSHKHNEYTENTLHVRRIIICSDGMILHAHTSLHEYY
jgi:hypothetical protein